MLGFTVGRVVIPSMTRNYPTPGMKGSSPDLPLMILVMVDLYIESDDEEKSIWGISKIVLPRRTIDKPQLCIVCVYTV